MSRVFQGRPPVAKGRQGPTALGTEAIPPRALRDATERGRRPGCSRGRPNALSSAAPRVTVTTAAWEKTAIMTSHGTAQFVAHQSIFNDTLQTLRHHATDPRPYHILITGAPGSGKTTLLDRIADHLARDPAHTSLYSPFRVRAIPPLADLGLAAKLSAGITDYSQPLAAVLADAPTHARRPVLLVDNLHNRVSLEDFATAWSPDNASPFTLIATATGPLMDATKFGSKYHLNRLDAADCYSFWTTTTGQEASAHNAAAPTPLELLSDGSPRLLARLAQKTAAGHPFDCLRDYFVAMADHHAAHLRAITADLPDLERRVYAALSHMWEGAGPSDIAKALFLDASAATAAEARDKKSRVVSTMLGRLHERQLISYGGARRGRPYHVRNRALCLHNVLMRRKTDSTCKVKGFLEFMDALHFRPFWADTGGPLPAAALASLRGNGSGRDEPDWRPEYSPVKTADQVKQKLGALQKGEQLKAIHLYGPEAMKLLAKYVGDQKSFLHLQDLVLTVPSVKASPRTELPSALWQLKHLRRLFIVGAPAVGIAVQNKATVPSSPGDWRPDLKRWGAAIHEIPGKISELKELRELWIAGHVSAIPKELTRLTKLRRLGIINKTQDGDKPGRVDIEPEVLQLNNLVEILVPGGQAPDNEAVAQGIAQVRARALETGLKSLGRVCSNMGLYLYPPPKGAEPKEKARCVIRAIVEEAIDVSARGADGEAVLARLGGTAGTASDRVHGEALAPLMRAMEQRAGYVAARTAPEVAEVAEHIAERIRTRQEALESAWQRSGVWGWPGTWLPTLIEDDAGDGDNG